MGFTAVWGEECVVSEGVTELRSQYGIIQPLCFFCQSEGKTHKVTHPNNVSKKP